MKIKVILARKYFILLLAVAALVGLAFFWYSTVSYRWSEIKSKYGVPLLVVSDIEQGTAKRKGVSLFPGRELRLFQARAFQPDDYLKIDCYLIFCEDRSFNGTVENILSGSFGASVVGLVFTYSPAIEVIAFQVVDENEFKRFTYSACDIRFR